MKKRIVSLIIIFSMLCAFMPMITSAEEEYYGVFMKDGIFIELTPYTDYPPDGSVGVAYRCTRPSWDEYGYARTGLYLKIGEIYRTDDGNFIIGDNDELALYYTEEGVDIYSCGKKSIYEGKYTQVSNVGANMSPEMMWIDIPERTEKNINNAYIDILENCNWDKTVYYVADVNNDKVKDLILLGEWGYSVLTYSENTVVNLYELGHNERPEEWGNFEWSQTCCYEVLNNALCDVPSSWAETDIASATELELIPEDLQCDWQMPITRLDFCRLAQQLYVAVKGGGLISVPQDFTDISDLLHDEQFTVNAMATLGIVSGYEDRTFRPNNEITRQEAAVLLMRTAKTLGKADPLEQTNIDFEDCRYTADWAMQGIEYVYNAGIMYGTDERQDGLYGKKYVTFSPYSTYTREQAMVTFYRLYDMLKSQPETDEIEDKTDENKTVINLSDLCKDAFGDFEDAVEEYQESIEEAVDTYAQKELLIETMKQSMNEYWEISSTVKLPDEVYEALYMYTINLDEIEVMSKNVNWSSITGLIEGALNITVTTVSSIGSGKYQYMVGGMLVVVDATNVGKSAAGQITWRGNTAGFGVKSSKAAETYKELNEQCLELINDIYDDELQAIAEDLTGFKNVSEFLQIDLKKSVNNKAKKLGLGDINTFVGNAKTMYDLYNSVLTADDYEDLAKQIKKLAQTDLTADTTLTNAFVKSAASEVEKEKNKLAKALENYIYGIE